MNDDILKSPLVDYDEKEVSGIGRGEKQPDVCKKPLTSNVLIDLPILANGNIPQKSFFACTTERNSRRVYNSLPMNLFDISFICFCTQGIKKVIKGYMKYIKDGSGRNYLRCVPVVMNPFETYIVALNIDGLKKGIYRYLPLDNKIELTDCAIGNIEDTVAGLFNNRMQNQDYVKKAAAVFLWTCLPDRAKWRNVNTYKRNILVEIGHISQNFYLAAEALDCGCVEIAGYRQVETDQFLKIDGRNEFTIQCAAIGNIDKENKDPYYRLPNLI